MNFDIRSGDCRTVITQLISEGIQVNSIVTDPPYEINHMGKGWDSTGVPFQMETWQLAYSVLKPGGYLIAFGAARCYHRLAIAIENAGFEIRDSLMWLYGNGFPKSDNIGKRLDRYAGVQREVVGEQQVIGFMNQNVAHGTHRRTKLAFMKTSKDPITDEAKKWGGYGTNLKPAFEPIVCARKPLSESSVAKNLLMHDVGGLNIEASRTADARWPANVIHDGSEIISDLLIEQGGDKVPHFFFCARASQKERRDFTHPTIKPLALMQHLVGLVTPPKGMVLDMFAGTGTTGEAALLGGFKTILIEQSEVYLKELNERLKVYEMISY